MEKENFLSLIPGSQTRLDGKSAAKYRCVCGKEVTKRTDRVKNGITRHCGCKSEIHAIIGEKFNMLTLIEHRGIDKKTGYQLGFYECDCGGFKELLISHVRRGVRQSCGCMLRVQIEPGQRFNQLVALCPTPWLVQLNEDNRSRWIFQCDCGDKASLLLSEVARPRTPRTTCGGNLHPKTKAGRVNNMKGKTHVIPGRSVSFITPQGETVAGNTISEVIRKYAHLFDPEDLPDLAYPAPSPAYEGLRHLRRVKEFGLSEHNWKGWSISETERLRVLEEYKEKNQIDDFEINRRAPGPDHFSGKYWELIGPHGERMEGFNLHELVRQHEEFFSKDDIEWTSAGCNATHCLRILFMLWPDGSRKLSSWKGWTIGAKMERDLALMQARCLEVLREQRLMH